MCGNKPAVSKTGCHVSVVEWYSAEDVDRVYQHEEEEEDSGL